MMAAVVSYPSFKDTGKAASNGVPAAQLLWMAIAMLSTEPGYSSRTPEEVFAMVVDRATQVYPAKEQNGNH